MNTKFDPHSSFIKEVQYTESTQTLRLKMNGHFYYYVGVTKQKLARFKKATSRGAYFSRYIKGQYKSHKRKASK